MSLDKKFSNKVEIKLDGQCHPCNRASDDKQDRALHGLTRAMIANMAHGVEVGYSKELEIVGVGFRAQLSGKKLVMNLGFTHTVEVEPKEGISFEVPMPDTDHLSRALTSRWLVRLLLDTCANQAAGALQGQGYSLCGRICLRSKKAKSGM